MSIKITKLTNNQYIINGKTMFFENGKWKSETEPLSDIENNMFKQHLKAEMFNIKSNIYAIE